MTTIVIPDETYQRLARRAAVDGTTVEALALPALEQLGLEPPDNSHQPTQVGGQSPDEWLIAFDNWMAEVEARAPLYLPGFVLDTSREAMYEGCGE